MSANYQVLLSTSLPLGTLITNLVTPGTPLPADGRPRVRSGKQFGSFISMRPVDVLRLCGNTSHKPRQLLQIFIKNQHPFSFIQKQT